MPSCAYCNKQIPDDSYFCIFCGHQLTPPPQDAAKEKICPYCQQPIAANDNPVICPLCQLPHHQECWTANNSRCTTYGCGIAPASRSPIEVNLDEPPMAYQSRDKMIFYGFFVFFILFIASAVIWGISSRPTASPKPTLTANSITVANSDAQGNMTGSPTNCFSRSELKFALVKTTIMSNNSKPLKGRIGVKYLRPDGSLIVNNASPPNYTTVLDFAANPTTQLWVTWGSADGAFYSPGTYTVEFWYDNKKIGNTSFTVYEKPPGSIVIRDLKLKNTDKSGKTISEYNNGFISSELRYVHYSLTIASVDGKYTQGKLQVKYITPSGELMTNPTTSPPGFTYEKQLSLPNTQVYECGWGNSDKSVYPPGTYRIEFYWNGQQLDTQYFEVR